VRLRQVFWNLIRNAIKFSVEAGRISVRSWNSEDRVMVEVADDGRGIAPADLARLFVPFDQLDRSGTGGLGLGLGLTISRGLMELQGGRLTAHSGGLGRGARFVAELDAVDPPTEALPTRAESNLVPRRAASAKPLVVLLVEDHQDTREMMHEILEQNGFRVHAAASATEAKRLDVGEIDLIVCDLGLPDQSGLELIGELQSRRRRPALALSGYGMESDVRASKAAGFDAHLVKPVDVDVLLETLRGLALLPA
jgi:CheY-like chemotaxis protein